MKLSKLKTKVTALVLTIALCLTGLVTVPSKAEAATDSKFIDILTETGDAAAGTLVQYDFTIKKTSVTYLDIYVSEPVDMSWAITTAGNQVIDKDDVASTDSNAWIDISDSTRTVYVYPIKWPTFPTGNYTISLAFGTDTHYTIDLYQDAPPIKMNKSKLNLTVGFSETLKVSDASSKNNVTWSTSKSSVASVKNGKVTAKKAGTATITAKDKATGKTTTCKVTVQKNVYTNNKATVSNVSYGNAALFVTKMNYDSKGNLLVNVKFVNNSGKKVVQLKNATITIKNQSNKKIGSISIKNKKLSVLQGGTRTLKYTIKKSKLSLKPTQNLPNASCSIGKKSTYVTQGY